MEKNLSFESAEVTVWTALVLYPLRPCVNLAAYNACIS